MDKKRIIGIAGLVLATVAIIVTLSVLKKNKSGMIVREKEVTSYGFSMGTSTTFTLYGDDETALKNKANALNEKLEVLDSEVISWRSEGSEVARANEKGGCLTISKTLYELIKGSKSLYDDTDGALDFTLRPVLNVWGIEAYTEGDDFKLPDEEELKKAKEKTGCNYVSVCEENSYENRSEIESGCNDIDACDTENISRESDAGATEDGRNTVTESTGDSGIYKDVDCGRKYKLEIEKEGITLDFGSTGKGYALDIIADELASDDTVKGGVFAVGGSVLCYGEKEDEAGFKIGIRDPEKSMNDMLGYIKVGGKDEGAFSVPESGKVCISTSGSYEKYVDFNGKRYHHIIDPKTLYPAESGLVSVTIVCENGLYSDGLSTAVFIMGYDASLEVLKKNNAEAIFIFEDGSIKITEGLEGAFVIN